MIQLSKGDLSAEVPSTTRSDEVGKLARAFHVFRETSMSLITSEQRFRNVFQHAVEGISRTTVDGLFIEVNPAMARMHGCRSSQEFIAHYGDDIYGKYYANVETRDDLVTLLKQSGFITGIEVEVKHMDGSTFWIAESARAVINENGEIDGFESFVHDISERKRIEEDLNNALAEAERANSSKSEFLATMSHEFRTPLNAILGFSELMRSQYFGPLGSNHYEGYADDIHDSGVHMLALVNDVLDVAAIEAGKRSVFKEMIALGELLRDCVKSVEKVVEDGGIALSLEVPDNLPSLYFDRRSVTQIVLNVLSNATKFTNRNGAICVSANAINGAIVVSVKDTGIGIPADKLGTVTEPFSQAGSNPHLSREGTGLGLSIVKSLIEADDGNLHIDSEVGAGTTVSLTFPCTGPDGR